MPSLSGRRLPHRVLALGALGVVATAVAVAAAPAITQVNGPARVTAPAERVTPPAAIPTPAGPTLGGDNLHPDFGENPSYGIPFTVVPVGQPLVPITFLEGGADESDPGPYPFPLDAPIEGGGVGDAHVVVL